MSIAHLEKAFQLIDENMRVVHISGPKSIEQLHKSEALLGLTFPPTYRRFVLRCGTIAIGCSEFYGLTRQCTTTGGIPDVVWRTLAHRQRFNLPHHLIPFYACGDGADWAIDTSRVNDERENPIVEYCLGEPEPIYEVIAPDFGFLLLEEVRMALSMRPERRTGA